DRACFELCLDVGERNLDELDRGGVAAVSIDGGPDREVTGGAEAVDGDLLAGEILRGGQARGSESDDGVDVVAFGEAVCVVADDGDTEVLQVGADRPERLTDGELDITAEERRDGLRAALCWNDLDLEAVIGEDPLVDRGPQGAGLGDR